MLLHVRDRSMLQHCSLLLLLHVIVSQLETMTLKAHLHFLGMPMPASSIAPSSGPAAAVTLLWTMLASVEALRC